MKERGKAIDRQKAHENDDRNGREKKVKSKKRDGKPETEAVGTVKKMGLCAFGKEKRRPGHKAAANGKKGTGKKEKVQKGVNAQGENEKVKYHESSL